MTEQDGAALVFIAICAVIALVGLGMILATRSFLGRAERTTGVVEIFEHAGIAVAYAKFKGPRGDDRSARVADGSSKAMRKLVGLHVPVLFDPSNPIRARVDSPRSLWSLPIALLVVGLSGIVIFTWALLR